MLRLTKSAVLDCLDEVLRLKKQHNLSPQNRTIQVNLNFTTYKVFQRNKTNRDVLTTRLFLKLCKLVVLCDREAVIEPNKSNTKALLGQFRTEKNNSFQCQSMKFIISSKIMSFGYRFNRTGNSQLGRKILSKQAGLQEQFFCKLGFQTIFL